ncbi:polymer-forming cytoskeletal protein [Melittangium boletus]|uniref:Cell shape determination protein CcmA n=1 Tax=Melittangium boletus DSM 14713 TaxID=1294270 RepID=A0A250IPW5_9BACT|nr:polymer-forming cytoskeletal protein [Melittangium boletus]ATB33211.1 hypothetical protein MEBOL_006700 [Melittangium boletus DSM 14713]
MDVVVRAGATVKAVMVIRGSVTVESGARVEGNVVALKGDVHVADGAILKGRASALSGRVHAASGARILGEKPELFTRVHEEDVLRALWGHILSDKDPGYCEPRIIGD